MPLCRPHWRWLLNNTTHVVTRVSQILDLELDVLTRRQASAAKRLGRPRGHGRRPLCRGSIPSIPVESHSISGSSEVECSLVIAPPKGLNQVTNDLNVLLRHRPRSIPRGRGGCWLRAARSENLAVTAALSYHHAPKRTAPGEKENRGAARARSAA